MPGAAGYQRRNDSKGRVRWRVTVRGMFEGVRMSVDRMMPVGATEADAQAEYERLVREAEAGGIKRKRRPRAGTVGDTRFKGLQEAIAECQREKEREERRARLSPRNTGGGVKRGDRDALGTVYFLRCHTTRLVKIGFTARTSEARIEGMRTGCPTELRLEREECGTVNDEQDLHQRYARKWVRGEWFALTDEDVTAAGDWLRSIYKITPAVVEFAAELWWMEHIPETMAEALDPEWRSRNQPTPRPEYQAVADAVRAAKRPRVISTGGEETRECFRHEHEAAE